MGPRVTLGSGRVVGRDLRGLRGLARARRLPAPDRLAGDPQARRAGAGLHHAPCALHARLGLHAVVRARPDLAERRRTHLRRRAARRARDLRAARGAGRRSPAVALHPHGEGLRRGVRAGDLHRGRPELPPDHAVPDGADRARRDVSRRRRVRASLLGAVALAALGVGIGCYEGGAFKSLELSTIDTRFSWRGTEKPPADLVVIGIDAATQNELNTRWPFPRSYHARVIDRLKAGGARTIAVDIALRQPSGRTPRFCGFAGAPLPPDDCALLKSSAHAGNVVFSATEVGPRRSIPFIGQTATPSIMREFGARAGYTGIVDDADGSARRYLYGFNGLKSFAPAVVERE